ncbi:putative serine/threonine-protein phosphatase [Sugiyamaella lignohabitans]|uniref:Putative serine/threonine-protein phosphatase n=1 Tax=Sugiyamaella lignohabitans TaxID=796027 RepID=A0A167CZH8_9ASCO|nr:putative serine/threonine-protein phosphatase [Sugiyamaella lignohabitans]ANB12292.1 putative serine/threonine-protein phosphatase [Sugiyamaella lignohabitans]
MWSEKCSNPAKSDSNTNSQPTSNLTAQSDSSISAPYYYSDNGFNYNTYSKDLEAGYTMSGNNNNGDTQPLLGTAGSAGFGKPPKRSRLWSVFIFSGLAVLFTAVVYIFAFTIPNIQRFKPVPNLVRVNSLDEEHLPSYEDGSKLLLVGDVHGSYSELKQLLRKAKFRKNRDHLVMLGDFITKGDRSIDVIELAMDLGASCVRGNHENEILEMYAEYHHLPRPRVASSTSGNGTSSDQTLPYEVAEMPQMRTNRLDESDDDDLVRLLKPKHIEYLGSCPLILQLGDGFDRGFGAIAVHAGVMWNLDNLEEQDPTTVMTVRSVLPPDYVTASEESDGEPWYNLWNEKQRGIPRKDRIVVYYGHNARDGLNLQEYTKGLDSGCIKGRELSGLLISESKRGKYKEKLIQVDC